MQPSALAAAASADSLDAVHGRALPLEPEPPRWVRELVPAWHLGDAHRRVVTLRSGSLVWLTTAIRDAGRLASDALRAEVARAYAGIGRTLAGSHAHAWRLWNYLPDPGERMGQALDRYMVFNSGRHDGYAEWLDTRAFAQQLPTATAVGVTGGDLVVHCLASDAAGLAVHNPRQRQPWLYSRRYGPLPPTFSRGTIARIGGRRLLLIGGTASIVGEDSQHVGNAAAQLDETIDNLVAMIAKGTGRPESPADALARLIDLRVYAAPGTDAAALAAGLRQRCGATPIETTVARLCRPELLVEIEGVAELPDGP